MPDQDGSTFDYVGIIAVCLLVAANGLFVAAEFSLSVVTDRSVSPIG